MNSSLISLFRFSNVVPRKEKSKKEKWQCSQNLDLNPTCALFDIQIEWWRLVRGSAGLGINNSISFDAKLQI